jgi:hypothetical protein
MKIKNTKCHLCSKTIRASVTYFSFGAYIDQLSLKKKNMSNKIMEGYCNIGYHGKKSDMSDCANYSVANGIKGGQEDICFCSLSCLRKWFNKIVDYLEWKLGKRSGREPRVGIKGMGIANLKIR